MLFSTSYRLFYGALRVAGRRLAIVGAAGMFAIASVAFAAPFGSNGPGVSRDDGNRRAAFDSDQRARSQAPAVTRSFNEPRFSSPAEPRFSSPSTPRFGRSGETFSQPSTFSQPNTRTSPFESRSTSPSAPRFGRSADSSSQPSLSRPNTFSQPKTRTSPLESRPAIRRKTDFAPALSAPATDSRPTGRMPSQPDSSGAMRGPTVTDRASSGVLQGGDSQPRDTRASTGLHNRFIGSAPAGVGATMLSGSGLPQLQVDRSRLDDVRRRLGGGSVSGPTGTGSSLPVGTSEMPRLRTSGSIPSGERLSIQDIRKRIGDRSPSFGDRLPGGDSPRVRQPPETTVGPAKPGTVGPDRPRSIGSAGLGGLPRDLRSSHMPGGLYASRSHSLNNPQASGGKVDLKHISEARFPSRLRAGDLDRLAKGPTAQHIKLADQYRMYDKGDVARRMNLHKSMDAMRGPGGPHAPPHHHPGFHHHYPHFGHVSINFAAGCFTSWYSGPSYLGVRCWYPRWSPWVQWSWGYHCHPIWDPRPIWCRPVIYEVAPVWGYYEVPVWAPLPVTACGTWVDVQPVVVQQQYDLQLLAVRFVDPGHPEEHLGPRYRVWLRNNSNQPVTRPFNVTLVASSEARPRPDSPQAGVRVMSIEAGDTQSVDIRLPFEANQLGRDAAGQAVPFSTLHVLIDANREVPDANRSNNGASLARAEVLPVDPAAFEVDPTTVQGGGDVVLAGEGFGPEPGMVIVQIGAQEIEGEILGWYDLGVRVRLPNLLMAGPAKADLIVIRGDGAAANPLQITVSPGVAGPAAVVPPVLVQ